jgi:hypothetical protein
MPEALNLDALSGLMPCITVKSSPFTWHELLDSLSVGEAVMINHSSAFRLIASDRWTGAKRLEEMVLPLRYQAVTIRIPVKGHCASSGATG